MCQHWVSPQSGFRRAYTTTSIKRTERGNPSIQSSLQTLVRTLKKFFYHWVCKAKLVCEIKLKLCRQEQWLHRASCVTCGKGTSAESPPQVPAECWAEGDGEQPSWQRAARSE